MIDSNRVLSAVLWATIEDYAGLWEIVWELNSMVPSVEQSERFELARATVERLVKDGLVILYRAPEPYGDLAAIPADEALALTVKAETWAPPSEEGPEIRAGATAAGEAFYRQLIQP